MPDQPRRVVILVGPEADATVERLTALASDSVQVDVDPAGARLLDAVAVMDRLRSPGGCPWDAQQTHDSLKPYLLEEAYEAYQAIEDGDFAELRDELGDVLLQVLFHARVAREEAGWTVDDVAGRLVEKLVRRHPHVFGDTTVADAQEVQANWDVIKAGERPDASPLADVPLALPALTLAAKLLSRAAKAGLPAPETDLDAELAAFCEQPDEETLGRLLFALVARARAHRLDAEAALRRAAVAFREQAVPGD